MFQKFKKIFGRRLSRIERNFTKKKEILNWKTKILLPANRFQLTRDACKAQTEHNYMKCRPGGFSGYFMVVNKSVQGKINVEPGTRDNVFYE